MHFRECPHIIARHTKQNTQPTHHHTHVTHTTHTTNYINTHTHTLHNNSIQLSR
ncbi:hypothetical protein NP493_7100g00000 [Ridgeia piscesae]|uniref:Uncharacterized protein n=1 Tax=Ridgeia piscesae TaxID=27915 RepID=A0AAD9IQ64_RIDPI|nr:hypothetical protein NP493_7100g00000 [Ridgeia piscesae]